MDILLISLCKRLVSYTSWISSKGGGLSLLPLMKRLISSLCSLLLTRAGIIHNIHYSLGKRRNCLAVVECFLVVVGVENRVCWKWMFVCKMGLLPRRKNRDGYLSPLLATMYGNCRTTLWTVFENHSRSLIRIHCKSKYPLIACLLLCPKPLKYWIECQTL